MLNVLSRSTRTASTLKHIRYFGATLLLLLIVLPATTQELLQDTPSLEGVNIYFAESNNEHSQFDRTDAGVSRYAGLLQRLGANLFTLEWRKGIPADTDMIVIVGPQRNLSANQVARLWSYLNEGGRVLLLSNVEITDGRVGTLPQGRDFFELSFADLGLQALDAVLLPSPVDYEAPDASNLAEIGELQSFITSRVNPQHPITAEFSANGLNTASDEEEEDAIPVARPQFLFRSARPLQIDASLQDFSVSPLLFTEGNLYGETDLRTFSNDNVLEYNIGEDIAPGRLILAAAYESTERNARFVLIGDSDIVRNGSGFQTSPAYSASFLYPDNVRFMLNVATWLLESEPATFDFSTPAPTATATTTPSPTPEPTSTPQATPEASN
jgi:hypothetical protein